LIYPCGKSSFTINSTKNDKSSTVNVDESSESIKINFEGHKIAHIIKLQLSGKPKKVVLDNNVLEDGVDYEYEPDSEKLIIKTDSYSKGEYLIER
jgi:hypothetical protein